MRNWLVVIFLCLLIILSFLIWGDWFVEIFSSERAVEVLQYYGYWAWGVGILLLMADLFLPLPGTIIMSALGYIYGPVVGGILAAVGSFLSGLLAYTLCRLIGRKGAERILGKKDLEKGELRFAMNGGWIVAVSRWLPVIPEVVACMAGLNQMKLWHFTIALACGSIPLGFVFAYVGYVGLEHSVLAIVISATLPPFLWLIAQWTLRNLIK